MVYLDMRRGKQRHICDVCQSPQCQNCANLTASEIRAVAIKKTTLFLCECCKAKFENSNEVKIPNKLLSDIISKLKDIQEEFKN
ncbi:hypothetical protein NQ314_015390 [Rhamnusium bicolor]|uniref:Uncharacterized protein n=1 Tax=Rhamnusium bicolor TaxID=1586634 RepID=A0AAV8WYA4_9CUCU|nr:hypothetical protein NQ314_015390 [Rhamnusium bicolor]